MNERTSENTPPEPPVSAHLEETDAPPTPSTASRTFVDGLARRLNADYGVLTYGLAGAAVAGPIAATGDWRWGAAGFASYLSALVGLRLAQRRQ